MAGAATGWLVQAENAFKNMMTVGADKEGKPTAAAKPGFNDALAQVPSFGLSGSMANLFRGADRQKFIQASSSLSEALLRAATGAGVNKEEAEQKVRELTPQFGEDDAVTQQKYAAIPLYIESLKVRAGPGAGMAAGVLIARGLLHQLTPLRLVGTTFLASLVFFVLSNFGVFISGYYGYSLEGLIACYVAAIPFWQNSLIADFTSTALVFAIYLALTRAIPSVKVQA